MKLLALIILLMMSQAYASGGGVIIGEAKSIESERDDDR